MPGQLTLHLRTADGHGFELTIPAPAVRPRTVVRLTALEVATVAATSRFDGATWQPIGAP